MQLFCFTFAGGTSAFYDQLEQAIDPCITVEKLEYAGHGSRHREAFYADFTALAEDLYKVIKDRRVGNYAFLGYSMGSISATEVLRLIIKKHEIPLPQYVFLAAHEPFSRTHYLADMQNIDEKIKKRTIEFGGIPEKLVNNKSFWRMYLPIYKNDYLLIERYDFDNLGLNTKIPLKVFYSETDTPLEGMKMWSKYYTGQADYVRYEGQHFFMTNHCVEMCHEIEKSLWG